MTGNPTVANELPLQMKLVFIAETITSFLLEHEVKKK